jgi:GMP synthase-like glutamine amidotransferase
MNKMEVQVLKHVPFEDIGSMAPWLLKKGATIHYTRFYEKPILPNVRGLDLIIIMGGPMSVNDEKEFPWLRSEKEFIKQALDKGVPVLGVCLGAQLMASALGCRVYRNHLKEIGWFSIQTMHTDHEQVFQFPENCAVFHWHGETFDIPHDAIHLAKSEACENQAFQIGEKAIALQFHLETTAESAQALLEHSEHELVPGPFIQSRSQLLMAPKARYQEINQEMNRVLTYLTR